MLFFTRGVLCPREEDPCRGDGLCDYRAIQFGGPSFRFLFDRIALSRGTWILSLQAGGKPTGTGGRT